jgi:hypothetical protein
MLVRKLLACRRRGEEGSPSRKCASSIGERHQFRLSPFLIGEKGSNLSGWASGISEQHQSSPNAFLMGKNLRYFRIIKMWPAWFGWTRPLACMLRDGLTGV